jgi:hypothetical protein
MEDETYRRIFRMKALERWENEGGRIPDNVTSVNRGLSPAVSTTSPSVSRELTNKRDVRPSIHTTNDINKHT